MPNRAGPAGVLLLAGLVLAACTAAPPSPGPGTQHVPAAGVPAAGAPAAGGPAVGSTAWVRAENARPGSTAWRPGAGSRLPGLDGYADRVSVLPGQDVGLNIDGHGPVTLRAFRFGWYGGAMARLVWSGRAVATRQPAAITANQPIPDAGGVRDTRVVIAPWHTTTVVGTAGWAPGEYLFRLDAGGVTRYVPLTVRSDRAAGRELLVAGTMTWQAYNLWGGRSLYGDEAKDLGNRSFAVSYDRPYSDGAGAGRWPQFDSGVVVEAERAGVPLAYSTDYDLGRDASILHGAAAVVFGGHAEYWTGPMRDAVAGAVAAGTNLAVFGANTAYWRVRLAGRQGPSGLPAARRDGAPRLIFAAKDASRDPLAAGDPGGATAKFHQPPGARPEDTLTGVQYDCHPAEAPLTIADPGWWGFAGTGLKAGQQLAHVVGPESDRVAPGPGRPTPEQIVAYTRFSCAGTRPTAQTTVYFVARSGAGVFTAGTMRWACASVGYGCSVITDQRAVAQLGQVTRNILAAFAAPRAGTLHPATDNVGKFWLPPRSLI